MWEWRYGATILDFCSKWRCVILFRRIETLKGQKTYYSQKYIVYAVLEQLQINYMPQKFVLLIFNRSVITCRAHAVVKSARPYERPMCKWMGNIKMNLKKTGWKGEYWI
jgi:hypothetical protein